MKKKILMQGLIGFPVGIAVGFVITLIVSVILGTGEYHPVTPEFAELIGNELNATILQAILCGIIGSGFGIASLIWTIDAWSLAKQSGIYFATICVLMFPIAYITNWMKHSLGGVLRYVGIFAAIFAFVWIVEYLILWKKIRKMNASVKRMNQ